MLLTQNYSDPTAAEDLRDLNTSVGSSATSRQFVPVRQYLQLAIKLLSSFISAPSALPVNYQGNSVGSLAVLALTTYPAIYKTFAGDGVKFQTPRVYPPILITNRQ